MNPLWESPEVSVVRVRGKKYILVNEGLGSHTVLYSRKKLRQLQAAYGGEKMAMSRSTLRCGSVAASIKKPKGKVKKATLEKRGFWRKWKTLDDVEAEITADDIKKARKAGMSEAKIRRRYGPTIKTARTLSARGRNQISEKNFALPGGRYPIHDASHARNALSRVAQHGTASEQAQVRAAVARKYPGIGQEKNAMKKTASAHPHMGKTAMSKNRVSSGVSTLDRIYGRRGQNHVSDSRNTGNYVEKTAMPSMKQLLAGLGIGGALGVGGGAAIGAAGGAAAAAPIAGAAGYQIAKKRGEKIDAQTPYHMGHMRYAHGTGRQQGRRIGRAEVIMALRRMQAAQSQKGKTKKAFVTPALVGGATGALTAPEGQRQQGALGGAAGGLLGGMAGAPALGTLGAVGGGLGGAALGGAAGTLAGIPGGPVGMVAGGAGGASAGGTLGAALGGGLGSTAGLLGGSALGGYAGGRLMTDRPKKKKAKKEKGEGKTITLKIVGGKIKQASGISPSAVYAANAVLEMRKSAHVNLRIPADVLGY